MFSFLSLPLSPFCCAKTSLIIHLYQNPSNPSIALSISFEVLNCAILYKKLADNTITTFKILGCVVVQITIADNVIKS